MNKILWRKSSYSHAAAADCVEVASLPHATGVRDSKVTDQGHLEVRSGAWTALLGVLKG